MRGRKCNRYLVMREITLLKVVCIQCHILFQLAMSSVSVSFHSFQIDAAPSDEEDDIDAVTLEGDTAVPSQPAKLIFVRILTSYEMIPISPRRKDILRFFI